MKPLSFFQHDHDAPSPSREFLRALVDIIRKERVSKKDFDEYVRRARARSGGVMSGRSRRTRRAESDSTAKGFSSAARAFCGMDAPPQPLPKRLAKDHDSVSYRESEVKPEDVTSGAAGAYEQQQRCGACRYFRSGNECQLVEGTVDAYGLCDLYEAAPRMFREGGSIDLITACDSERGQARVFFELPVSSKEAPAKSWIPYLPKPGTYSHPKYGEIQITRDRNRRFVDNFKQRVYGQNLPIDIEHDLDKSGAMGYATKLRQNSDGSVDAFVEWTHDGVEALQSLKYRYFSPQYLEAWKEPASGVTYEDVAIGGALTARPFFKEKHLRPLIASENVLEMSFSEPGVPGSLTKVRFESEEETGMTTKATTKGKQAAGSDEAGIIERLMRAAKFEGTAQEFADKLEEAFEETTSGEEFEDEAVEAAGDEPGDGDEPVEAAEGKGGKRAKENPFAKKAKKKAKAAVDDEEEEEEDDMRMTETVRSLREENKELRRSMKEKDTEVQSLSERLTEVESTEKRRRFRDVVQGVDAKTGLKDNARHFIGAPVDEHVEFLMALSEKFGEDSDTFKKHVAREQERARQFAAVALSEHGSSRGGDAVGGTPWDRIQAKASELVSGGKATTMDAAVSTVLKGDATLAREYSEWMRGVPTA